MSERDLRLEVILQAIDKATGPMKAIMGGSSKMAQAVKAARDELKNLERGQRDIAKFKDLQAGLQGTSEKLNAAQQHLRNMQVQLRAGGGDTAKFRSDFTKAHEAVRDLTRRVQEQRREMAPHAQKLREAGVNVARLGTHESELADKIKSANAALEEQKKRLEAVGIARGRLAKAMATRDAIAGAGVRLGATGAAIGGAMSVPINAYAEAEDAATQLRVSMMKAGGAVPADFDRINELAMRLGDRLPGTTADFQNMMTMLRRQGMSAQAILGGLGEATAYLGVQLKLPSEAAAEFAAKMQDATRTTEGDMMGLMDTIQRTFYVGVDPTNMLEGFSKLAPALDTIRMKGLAGARALAPLLAMADQSGMDGSAAGNAMRKVLQSAMDRDGINESLKALRMSGGPALALDFTNGAGEFGGLDQMFAQLAKLKTMNTESRLSLVSMMFGNDAEVQQIVSMLVEKGKDGYEEMLGKMNDQASIQDRVNKQLGTLRNLWEASSGTFTNFMVSLGESIAPELKAITEWLGNAAAAARRFATEHPGLTSAVMKTAAAIGILTAGLGAGALAISAVIGPFALARYSIAMFSTMAGPLVTTLMTLGKTVLPIVGNAILWVGRALFMNPIGLAVSGIALAALGIYKYWGPISDWFKRQWEGITSWLSSLGARFERIGLDLMLGLSRGISNAMANVKSSITGAADSTVAWFKEKLGIRSPSRVFAELGGFTMQGLAVGLQGAAGEPLAAIVRTARQLTAAGALGLAGAGVAIASPDTMGFRIDNRPPLAAAAPAGSGSVTNVAYTINITAGAGTDEGALRKLFRDELERHKRELEARSRSSLSDRY